MVQGILNYILNTNQSNQGIVKDRICGKFGNMGNNFIDIPQTSKMLENENIREFSLQEKIPDQNYCCVKHCGNLIQTQLNKTTR